MFTMNFHGHDVEVLEHIKEIKEKGVFFDTRFFNRFYNKKQMLKYYLEQCNPKKFYFDLEETFNLKACGGKVTIGPTDSTIMFVKIEDIGNDPDTIEFVIEKQDYGCFFMKDDNGQIYYVVLHED